MLVPTECGELNGPYFQATHDGFKTPFFSQDFCVKFGNGGAAQSPVLSGVHWVMHSEFTEDCNHPGLPQGGNVFNARISAYYQHGDLFIKGLNYAPDVANRAVDTSKFLSSYRYKDCRVYGQGTVESHNS